MTHILMEYEREEEEELLWRRNVHTAQCECTVLISSCTLIDRHRHLCARIPCTVLSQCHGQCMHQCNVRALTHKQISYYIFLFELARLTGSESFEMGNEETETTALKMMQPNTAVL